MPSASDHYRFAAEALDRIGVGADPSSGAFIADRRGLVLIGTQGPDPFYFHGLVPWRKREGVAEAAAFAEFLHSSVPAAIFPILAARAVESPAAGRDAAFAYLYGLLLHYLLDRRVHPYVYFRSGFDDAGELSGRYGADHARFETMMAEASAAVRAAAGGGGGGTSLSPSRLFAAEPAEPAELEIAGKLLARAFPDRIGASRLEESWRDMRTVLRTLRDPTGLKLRAVEALGGGASRACAMIWPRRIPAGDSVDYLNAANLPWRHPATGAESNASVAELTSEAAADAEAAARLLTDIRDGRASADDLAGALGAINHEGQGPGEKKLFSGSVYR